MFQHPGDALKGEVAATGNAVHVNYTFYRPVPCGPSVKGGVKEETGTVGLMRLDLLAQETVAREEFLALEIAKTVGGGSPRIFTNNY